MSTHIIGFYEDLTKIIFQLSSNTQLISSSDLTETVLMPSSTKPDSFHSSFYV